MKLIEDNSEDNVNQGAQYDVLHKSINVEI